MEAVKEERTRLLEQLAQVKNDPGKAGGELQEADILKLRHEVEIKKAKLNELHEVHPPPPHTHTTTIITSKITAQNRCGGRRATRAAR